MAYDKKFRQARKKKVKDTNGKCECCGGTGKTLHHKDGNRENDDDNNFIFVCRPCHGKLHFYLGTMKNVNKGRKFKKYPSFFEIFPELKKIL